MKRKIVMVLSILIVLVLIGFSAYTFNTKSLAMSTRSWDNNDRNDISSYGMMGGYNDDRSDNYGYGMMGDYNNSRVCGNRNGNIQSKDYDVSKLMPMEILEDNVKKYISDYDTNLKIEDIFVYSNTEYYFSIVEEDTGKGAMELLVDPVTGYVFPEYGPNMMWNTKYGMHGSNGYGMMGMMGGYDFITNFENDKRIDEKTALEKATNYLAKNSDSNLTVESGGHEFYGYYTFHVINDDETVGMVSVNYYTGEVWYHKWHGNLIEVISTHYK
ncbi:hypothetical protein [Vallitalea maricola]|uniref:Uncharacterized protein n=1 Tax=Vallitalea maricola TaxID=3074433 RepID=A0ACB5UQG3_9FIRM|nr:hypothetical protein AN2V17_40950 [Vallitalea sp. AN17-2]